MSSMPSLLMQAARSAAIADGLMPKGPSPPSGDMRAPQPKQEDNGDTVAAALAMVAAGNGGNMQAPAPARPSSHSSNGTNGAAPRSGPSAASIALPPAMSAVTATANNLSPGLSRHPGVSGSSGMQSLRQQPMSQQQKETSYPAPSSAGSAAHRLAVAASVPQQMVAPKPTISAPVLSHHSQSAPTAPRSSSSAGGNGGKKKGPPLRRGKWTPEEEDYANRLIMEFKAGLLPLTDGTTLRTFLSKLLNCDPMRISKKFVGGNCIGKQVFRRRTADINRLTPEQIQHSRSELSE